MRLSILFLKIISKFCDSKYNQIHLNLKKLFLANYLCYSNALKVDLVLKIIVINSEKMTDLVH